MVAKASTEQRPTMNADQMAPHTKLPPANPTRRTRATTKGRGKQSVEEARASDNAEAAAMSGVPLSDAAAAN